MQEYTYLSKRSNNTAKILSFALFMGGLLLLAATATFSLPYVGMLQGLCALLFTLSVLFLTRFFFKTFTLRVFANERGEYDFTVTENYGRTNTTVCRVSLDNIEKVCLCTKENLAVLKKESKGRKIFSYCPDVFPDVQCWVFVTECDEPLLLKISPDEKMLSILRAAADKKRGSPNNCLQNTVENLFYIWYNIGN